LVEVAEAVDDGEVAAPMTPVAEVAAIRAARTRSAPSTT
jgi:hypothetical protein